MHGYYHNLEAVQLEFQEFIHMNALETFRVEKDGGNKSCYDRVYNV